MEIIPVRFLCSKIGSLSAPIFLRIVLKKKHEPCSINFISSQNYLDVYSSLLNLIFQLSYFNFSILWLITEGNTDELKAKISFGSKNFYVSSLL